MPPGFPRAGVDAALDLLAEHGTSIMMTAFGRSPEILARTLAHARSMPGVQQVHLGVLSSNHAAIALYQRHGFVRYGVEPRCVYAAGAYHDEDWMVCML